MKPNLTSKSDPYLQLEPAICYDQFCTLALSISLADGAGIALFGANQWRLLGSLHLTEQELHELQNALPKELRLGEDWSHSMGGTMFTAHPIWEGCRRPVGALLTKSSKLSGNAREAMALSMLARQVAVLMEAQVSHLTNDQKMSDLVRTNARLTHSSIRFERMFHGLPVGCFTFDDSGIVIESNTEFERIFQTEGSAVFMQPAESLLPGYDGPKISQVFAEGPILGQEVSVDLASGEARTVLLHAFPINSEEGGCLGVAACVDITDRKRMELELSEANKKLQETSTRDGLTGLKNHRAFQEYLAQILSGRDTIAVLLLDVDHFKKFNDSFGHPAGDAVLKTVAALLTKSVRPDDFVARYGGEEFVVILKPGKTQDARTVAARINDAFHQQQWEHRDVTVSIGIATTESGVRCGAELIQQADIALYSSKHAGRDQATLYQAETLPKSA